MIFLMIPHFRKLFNTLKKEDLVTNLYISKIYKENMLPTIF